MHLMLVCLYGWKSGLVIVTFRPWLRQRLQSLNSFVTLQRMISKDFSDTDYFWGVACC